MPVPTQTHMGPSASPRHHSLEMLRGIRTHRRPAPPQEEDTTGPWRRCSRNKIHPSALTKEPSECASPLAEQEVKTERSTLGREKTPKSGLYPKLKWAGHMAVTQTAFKRRRASIREGACDTRTSHVFVSWRGMVSPRGLYGETKRNARRASRLLATRRSLSLSCPLNPHQDLRAFKPVYSL